MKEVKATVNVGCDCDATVTLDHHFKSKAPIQEFHGACACGRSFFVHVQEVIPKK
jgi:hypothetical protein